MPLEKPAQQLLPPYFEAGKPPIGGLHGTEGLGHQEKEMAAKKANLERRNKKSAALQKIDQSTRSPDLQKDLNKTRERAQKADLDDVNQALQALSEYDSVDILTADDDLLEEIAQARGEKTIWLARQKEIEDLEETQRQEIKDREIAEAAKVAKLKAGHGQVSSAAAGRAGQTGWTGGGRATVMPDSMAGMIAAQELHDQQLANRGVSETTKKAIATLAKSGAQIAARENQRKIDLPPTLPERNDSQVYDHAADLNTGRAQVGSAAAERTVQAAPYGMEHGGLRTKSGSFAEVQADSEAQAKWEAGRVESQETRKMRAGLNRSREQIAVNVGREAAQRAQEIQDFNKQQSDFALGRLPKGEAPKQEKPKTVWGRFVSWLKKPD